MRTLSEVVTLVRRVDRVELTQWIELGWVTPERPADVTVRPALSSLKSSLPTPPNAIPPSRLHFARFREMPSVTMPSFLSSPSSAQ